MYYTRVVSADSHVREPIDMWEKALGKKLGDRTPRVIHQHAGRQGRFFYTGRYVTDIGGIEATQDATFGRELRESGYVPEARVKFQVDAGIEAEIMNPSPTLSVMVSPADVAQSACAVFNDWLAEFCSVDPKRLIGNGTVPMHDVDWAVTELQRIVKKGLRGAIVNTQPPDGCAPYRDTSYDRFWAAAQDLDVPITLHIITGRLPDPLLYFHTAKEHEETPRAMLEVWNELQLVLANDFIFGGVLDRFPRLKIVSGEYEVSWLPHFMFRLDQMQADFAPRLPLPKLKMVASDYVKTRIWHGLVDDPYRYDAIPHVGVDQVLWGSDYPHIRSIGPDTQETLRKMFGDFTAAEQERIVGLNAIALYKL
jgi:predicted TIM-barrel fold metal-dependent hydrolase